MLRLEIQRMLSNGLGVRLSFQPLSKAYYKVKMMLRYQMFLSYICLIQRTS